MAYEDKTRPVEVSNNIMLEGRSKLTVTGVKDVESFYDTSVVLDTTGGTLVVKGRGLKLERLTLENGEIVANGDIDSVEYEEEAGHTGGFFSRLFG
jgi:sporulation protein YabP